MCEYVHMCASMSKSVRVCAKLRGYVHRCASMLRAARFRCASMSKSVSSTCTGVRVRAQVCGYVHRVRVFAQLCGYAHKCARMFIGV